MNTQRKRSTHQRGLRLTLLSLVTASSLVTACGGGDNTGGTAAPEATATGATEPQTSTVSEPPATSAPGPDPCDPIGTLTTEKYNDRCVGSEGEDFGENFPGVFKALNYWVDQSCPNGALVVAQRKQVLVTATTPENLDAAQARVNTVFPGSTANEDFISSVARIIDVPEDDVAAVLGQLPKLQGVGWSADLNYLEPLQPNNGFRPYDNPHVPVGDVQVPDTVPVNGAPSILVLDSTDNTSLYYVDTNNFVDEDHGHGVFVESIIERRSPQAVVTLQGVTSTAKRLDSGRWVPMMFSDSDLIKSMEPLMIDNSFDVVNLSLGGAGCPTSGHGWGVGERVALGRVMAAFSLANTNMRFVAAAGNDHGYADNKKFWHYPAAWRDDSATKALADAVDLQPDGETAGEEIRQIHLTLTNAMIAVGASGTDGALYTNCGDWINAKQPGTEIGTYPTSLGVTGTVQWSGTSFATANESALVAAGSVPTDSLPCPT